MVVQVPLMPALVRQSQVDLYETEASLVSMVTSKRGLGRDPAPLQKKAM